MAAAAILDFIRSEIWRFLPSDFTSVFGAFFSLCAKFCANMFDNDWVVAIKVHFKMAAAAILDFAGIEFWHQNCLWSMVFSPCVKFHANICHSGRDIAIKPIFKMGPPPSWIFSEVKCEVNSVSLTLFLVSVPNFVQICLAVTELWPLKWISKWRPPPSWILWE